MEISVVIPTWNEAAWLPRLLGILDRLHGIHEVIVADNNSWDGTAEIAWCHGARVIAGGRPGMARNAGARVATGEILTFIDADTVISQDVVRLLEICFARPKVVAVHFRALPITSSEFRRSCYQVMDLYFRLLSSAGMAFGLGSFIAVKQRAFDLVGGFNEHIQAAEDLDLLRRLSRVGTVEYVTETPVHVSSRRFDVENPALYLGKCLLWALLRLLGTDLSLVAYSWAGYPGLLAEQENTLLEAGSSSRRRTLWATKTSGR